MTKPKPRPVKAVKSWGWTIKHGRWAYIDYTRSKKRAAISAFVKDVKRGQTWKRLYASGARVVRVHVTILVPVKKP